MFCETKNGPNLIDQQSFLLKMLFFSGSDRKKNQTIQNFIKVNTSPPPLLSIEYCGTHKKIVKLEEDIEAKLCAFDVVVKKKHFTMYLLQNQ